MRFVRYASYTNFVSDVSPKTLLEFRMVCMQFAINIDLYSMDEEII